MAAVRILLICVVGLTLAGCDAEPREELTASPSGAGSGEGSPVPDRPPPGTSDDAVDERGIEDKTGMSRVELTLTLDDDYFKPTFIKVDSGAQLNVELENEGSRTHTFTVDERDIDEVIEAGGKKEVNFEVGSSEVVPFYCRFHRDQGMSGEFRLS